MAQGVTDHRCTIVELVQAETTPKPDYRPFKPVVIRGRKLSKPR